MRLSPRILVAFLLAIIAGVVAFRSVPPPLPELTRAEFLAEVRDGHVRQIDIKDQEVITGISATRGPFRTPFHRADDAGLAAELRAFGVEIRFTKSPLGLI